MTKRKDDVVIHPVETPEDEVEAYWTDERMAGARPLPFPLLEAEPEDLQGAQDAKESVSEEPRGPDDEAQTKDNGASETEPE